MKTDFKRVHTKCGWHENSILESKVCGCHHCLSIFPPGKIADWIEEKDSCPRGSGKTAVCPNCDIDSVLPDDIGHEITVEILMKMQKEFLKMGNRHRSIRLSRTGQTAAFF